VTIPDTVSSVADYAFYNCPSIRTVSLPSSFLPLRRIFSDYQSITSVTIANSSTNIPDYAFADCTSLTSVMLPTQIQTVGYAAFFNCLSLHAISLPMSIVSLGDWAFSCCTALESVTLPKNLQLIGSRAFSYCDSLTSITIPVTVTHIGDWAFAWSPNLASVTYAGNAPTMGTDIYSSEFSDVINHVMPWATGWGSTFAERPVERLEAQLNAPSITPSDGHVFQSNTSIIIDKTAYFIDYEWMSTSEATLRYTLDGSDPTPSSPIYSRFSVTNDTIIKARFFLFFGYEGAFSDVAQSGQILDNGESLFTIPLTGPGQVSFQWKTSCEKDDTGAMNWYYASIMLDGVEIARQDGETDWMQVSFAVPEGNHEISIHYQKDEVFSSGEDCIWVDNFEFMPSSPLVFNLGSESYEVLVSTNFTRNTTQQMIDSAVATYASAFPSAKPEDIHTLLSTADAMGLNMGLLGQGTNILLFSPQITISEIQFSYQGAPAETPPNQVAITFTLKNNITTPEEAVALLQSSASRRLEVLARAQLSGSIATIIPVSTQFSGDTITLTFQLLAAPAEAFFRIRLAHQLD